MTAIIGVTSAKPGVHFEAAFPYRTSYPCSALTRQVFGLGLAQLGPCAIRLLSINCEGSVWPSTQYVAKD